MELDVIEAEGGWVDGGADALADEVRRRIDAAAEDDD